MQTLSLLRDLIAFPTVSSEPNRELIDYCAALLRKAGAHVQLIEDDSGSKANLFATVGPLESGGVILSGHTDVVPVDGQDWTYPPFQLSEANGNVYGRGTADMKGFVAAALAATLRACDVPLRTPLHLALSYDEEIGCIGVRSMIEMLAAAPFRPRFCIVGEPTGMAVATGHKGKTAFRVTATGHEAHSALAPTGLNAIYLATEMIGAIRTLQDDLRVNGSSDTDYDIGYTTLHVGTIAGGETLNIVPNNASFMAEIRNLVEDDPQTLLDTLAERTRAIIEPHKEQFPNADLTIEVTNSYPPLGTEPDAEIICFVKSLTGANDTKKVAFGTEAGLFDGQLDVPTVVCGPGSMAQGHKPDEFVSREQLARCDAMLDALLERLQVGL